MSAAGRRSECKDSCRLRLGCRPGANGRGAARSVDLHRRRSYDSGGGHRGACDLRDAAHAPGSLKIRAAEKGLHLFVEKPVNLYIDQAIRVCEAIRKAG